MSQAKIAPLRAERAASKSLKLVKPRSPHPLTMEQAAYAVWQSAMTLSATPRYPNCQHLVEARQQTYDDAVAALREALNG